MTFDTPGCVARPPRSSRWLALAALAALAAALTACGPTTQQQSIMTQADGLPTITIYYDDGTRADAAWTLRRPWTPDRPVKMITVVGATECAILLDENLVVTEPAPPNRYAVCVWTAAA